jgi:hypothetical protein
MSIELLIEQVVSVGLLVIGLSYCVRAREWLGCFVEWRRNPSFPLYLGWLYLQVGSVIAFGHNVWRWDLVVIITAMGWLWTLKGVVYLLRPSVLGTILDKMMPAVNHPERKMAAVGAFMAVVGALLVWRVFIR